MMKAETLRAFTRTVLQTKRTNTRGERLHYLLKWLIISTLVGLIAGVGSIIFSTAIHFASTTFLGQFAGNQALAPAQTTYSNWPAWWNALRPWLLPLLTAAGGLLSGIIVSAFAPEAVGHGTDAAIQAFHKDETIRARVPLLKMVASVITIGSGGSAGLEGPSAQICAGFGSLLARALVLDEHDRRIALAIGLGAGIGAIFHTPLGGAVLAAEILYTSDIEIEVIFPALIASIIGYSTFGIWAGWHTLFTVPANLTFTAPPQLLYYAALGGLCGMVGLFYSRSFYRIGHFFHGLRLPLWVKSALGGLAVGVIGLGLPQVLGLGDSWLQISMGTALASFPIWLILLLPLAKILATSLTVGSGGSGGIFGPGLVIGGMLGAAAWRLFYPILPGLPATPAPFVIIGMIALFGSIAHAPLAVMLMVAEMTGNISLLAPAMIAVSIASILIGNETIYKKQMLTRADSPAHHVQVASPEIVVLSRRESMPLNGYREKRAIGPQPDLTPTPAAATPGE